MFIATITHHTDIIEKLRSLLPRLEGLPPEVRALPFGIPVLDRHLPQGGLALGALHEVAPAADADLPAAFGFIAALLGRLPLKKPVLLVLRAQNLAPRGRPHGHGLNGLGLDPGRVILAETADDKQALWALEEGLRSNAVAAVAGVIGAKLDLKMSQRLQLAASDTQTPLILLRPAGALGSNMAVTRWRIGAAPAARDRFGLIARWGWRVMLERCRNGRPGEWLVEFDHVTHRFSLAAALADPALSRSAGAPSFGRTG